MYQFRVKYIFPFLLCVLGVKAIAQTSTVSYPTSTRENDPYSRFGIGSAVNGNNTNLKGMGNISSAYADPYTINSDNPASYSFLKYTTYEAGMMASTRTLAANGQTYQTGTATLNYLTIGVPVNKHGGLVLGFRPISTTYYSFSDTGIYPGVGSVRHTFGGTGGLNYAYIGAAYQYKGLSLGFNFGYMFGSTTISSFADNIYDTVKLLNAEYSNYSKIGGLHWKGGVMYETKLKNNLMLRLGGTVELSQKLAQTQNEYWIGSIQFTDSLVQDTAYQGNQVKNKVILPLSYSFGVHLAKTEHWDIGVDYAATQWTQFRNNGIADTALANAYRVSVGGEFVPDITNSRNYWSRATYRVGIYYGTDPIFLQGTQLKYYGATAGVSLPFRRNTSQLHAALEVGKMGTQNNGLIEETYVKFSLGLSFNAKWFVKRRYE